jgi:hypothetical protein
MSEDSIPGWFPSVPVRLRDIVLTMNVLCAFDRSGKKNEGDCRERLLLAHITF